MSCPATGAAKPNGMKRNTRWVTGVPGVEIVRRAKTIKADLVVLGRDARSPRNPLPIGRTADAVMRRLDGLCLWIPPGTGRVKRILLALDGTRRGLGVLEPAARIAGLLKAEVTTIHVLPQEVSGAPDVWDSIEPAVERIREALGGMDELGGSESLVIRRGPPIWEILDCVDRLRIDLLVLGVRGGGPCGDMGSGHIGRDLLRTAPVAVLTIPI